MRRLYLGLVGLLASGLVAAAQAPQVSLTYTIGAGNVPTLTWSAPWASSCNASGSWTGVKAPSGSQAVAAITGTVTYRLTCVGPMDDQAALSWSAPTQYTDGTPLPSAQLGSYSIYKGTTASNLAKIQEVPNLSYVDDNLLAGTYFYAVSAKTVAGVESSLSAIGSKTITAAPSAQDEEVIRVPNPPMPGGVQ